MKALVVASASSLSMTAPTDVATSTSLAEQPAVETVSALQIGEFGLDKEKVKKRDRNRRHARHLLDYHRRKIGS